MNQKALEYIRDQLARGCAYVILPNKLARELLNKGD